MRKFIFLFLVLAACTKTEAPPTATGQGSRTITINGAGATFPNPVYSKWFSDYNKLHPDVQINYQSIGSGGGIKQITEKTVDFGASDAPMSEDELKKAPG